MSAPLRVPTLWLAVLLTAGAALAPASPGARQLDGDLNAHLAELLRESSERGEAGIASLSRGLARLGPESIPEVLTLLERGSFEGRDGEPLELRPDQAEALFGALDRFGSAPLVEATEHAVEGAPSASMRLVLLEVLGRHGTPRELELATRAATSAVGTLDRPHELALEDTVARILSRDPDGCAPLEFLIRRSEPQLAASLAMAAADTCTPQALEMVVDLLGMEPELDLVLLTQVGRLAASAKRPIDLYCNDSTREYLTAREPQLLRAAALACGRLEDPDAMDPLIELLEHADRSVRDAAHWSVKHMSGLDMPPEPARWRAWLAGERAWREGEARQLLRQLEHEDPARVVNALHELSRRRYQRDELAAEVAVALDDRRVSIRRATCEALGVLGSTVAVPVLLRCLDDPEYGVRHVAWETLRGLTRAELPEDHEDWSADYPTVEDRSDRLRVLARPSPPTTSGTAGAPPTVR